jgi:hypothetical protein
MAILGRKRDKIKKKRINWTSKEESIFIYFCNKFPQISNYDLFKKMKAQGYNRSYISIYLKRRALEYEIKMEELKKQKLNNKELKTKALIIDFNVINSSILDEADLIWELFNN